MMFGPPPQLPPNGATHPLQSTQSGNNISSGANLSNPMSNNIHQNHVNHSQQSVGGGGGTTQQLQHCNYGGARPHHQHPGMNGNRVTGGVPNITSNACFSNPAGVLPVAIAAQTPMTHQVTGPPPPYQPFQHTTNGHQGPPAYPGSSHGCNLPGVQPQIPFSAAGNYIRLDFSKNIMLFFYLFLIVDNSNFLL